MRQCDDIFLPLPHPGPDDSQQIIAIAAALNNAPPPAALNNTHPPAAALHNTHPPAAALDNTHPPVTRASPSAASSSRPMRRLIVEKSSLAEAAMVARMEAAAGPSAHSGPTRAAGDGGRGGGRQDGEERGVQFESVFARRHCSGFSPAAAAQAGIPRCQDSKPAAATLARDGRAGTGRGLGGRSKDYSKGTAMRQALDEEGRPAPTRHGHGHDVTAQRLHVLHHLHGASTWGAWFAWSGRMERAHGAPAWVRESPPCAHTRALPLHAVLQLPRPQQPTSTIKSSSPHTPPP